MNSRLSSFLFLRAYFLIAAGILIIAVVLDSLLVWLLPSTGQTTVERYTPEFALIEWMVMENGTAPDQMANRFNQLLPALEHGLNMPVALYDTAELGDQLAFITTLNNGQIVSYVDAESREILYKMLPATGQVIALGPLPAEPASVAFIETAVIFSYYILVALLLFWWIRPFYRDLSALRYAASQFGRDDFNIRVSVTENSSIFPVAQSFNKMAERIQYLVTAHRDLTNAVAHELRTPLARFKFAMEMIPKIKDEGRLGEHLAAMKTDVQELEGLIDEMLTYAKLSEDNLQVPLQNIPLEAWLQRQLSQYVDSAIPVQLRTATANPAQEARFNADLLARALHNIVRNCLRYADTAVVVSYAFEADKALVFIRDDGPGIPAEHHHLVFEPFARLDTSRDRQSGGYGLGLAIARRILQRHGGDICIDTHQTRGAGFMLTWPYN